MEEKKINETTRSKSSFSLDDEDALEWRNLLEQRRRAVFSQIVSHEHQAVTELSAAETGEISKLRHHPADLASDLRQAEVLGILADRENRQLQEIEGALERLERGEFGICEECEQSIARGRLKVLPEARYCTECERLLEEEPVPSPPPPTPVNWKKITVADIMREKPISVRMNEPTETAWELMRAKGIRHLPVVDDRGDIQGVVSDRDLLKLSSAPKTIKQVMTKAPETVTPEEDLYEAGTLLIENKISCLPVVEGNRLVGILTETDFVKLVMRQRLAH